MSEHEIRMSYRKEHANDWPTIAIICWAITLWFYSQYPEMDTTMKIVGFWSMFGAGLIHAVRWVIVNQKAENKYVREKLARLTEERP